MLKHNTQHGITFVEVIVVVSILVIIVGFSVSGFQNFARFQEFNQAVSHLSFTLQQAQTNARSAVNDSDHGVYIATSSVVLYSGSSYVPGDPNNIEVSYDNVVFSADVADGSDVIHFNKLTGVSQATGTVTAVGLNYTATSTVSITKAGIIE